MSDMLLAPDEMQKLTGRIQHRAQARELNHLGIVHKVRGDGSILVLRAHVEQVLGLVDKTPAAPQPQLNFGRLTDRPQLRSVRLAEEKALSAKTLNQAKKKSTPERDKA